MMKISLSPYLFAVLIHDIETVLKNVDSVGIQVDIYMKLLLLLFPDDSTLFSDSPTGLQKAIDTP